MLLYILTLVFSLFPLVHLLRCHGSPFVCHVPVEFGQPLPDQKTWAASCTPNEHTLHSKCTSYLSISYIEHTVSVELYGVHLTSDDSEPVNKIEVTTMVEVDYGFRPEIKITLRVECNTEDFCATNEIRRLLPMLNTMQGRSTDVFLNLSTTLIEPSSSLSASERNLSCFESNTKASQQCPANKSDSCYAASYSAGCSNNPAVTITVDFMEDVFSTAIKPHTYSWICCNRTNCNSKELLEQVAALAETFVLGKKAITSQHEHLPSETSEMSLIKTDQPHSQDQSPPTIKPQLLLAPTASSGIHRLTRPIYILVSIIATTILR